MSLMSIYRSRWVLSLCVVLSMALALQGAPTSKIPTLPGSERNSAPIHPKSSAKVGIPLLPPDEDLNTVELESENKQEEDFDSADGPISEFEGEEISGDNPIDYPNYLIPGPVKKPTIFEKVKPGSNE